MFRDYIYLDTKRIYRYGRKLMIDDSCKEDKDFVDKEMYFEKFEYKLESERKNKGFLEIRSDSEDDINKIDREMIIRFRGKLLIPDEFGKVEFLKGILSNDNMKNQLSDDLSRNDDEIGAEFLKAMIKDRKNFPVYCNIDEYKIYANLNGEFFIGEYSDFEENVGETVTIVARIDSISKTEKDIVLYNIYKDLFGMNRQMRRAFNDNNENIPEEIKIKGKGIKMNVLAIYR